MSLHKVSWHFFFTTKNRFTKRFYLAQRSLRELKSKISAQSKKNFVLERDVRYLDSRIALLIQNRIALDEVKLKY
jgi:hypothetical protein